MLPIGKILYIKSGEELHPHWFTPALKADEQAEQKHGALQQLS